MIGNTIKYTSNIPSITSNDYWDNLLGFLFMP